MYIRFFVVFFLLCVPVCCAADASGRRSIKFPQSFTNSSGKIVLCSSGGASFEEKSAFEELACDIADCSPKGVRLLQDKFACKILGTRMADVGPVVSSIVLLNMTDLAAFYGNIGALRVAHRLGIPIVWPWHDESEQNALNIKIALQRGHWKYIQKAFTPQQRAGAGAFVHRSLDGRHETSLLVLLKDQCIDCLRQIKPERSKEDILLLRDRHNALLTCAMLLSSPEKQARFAGSSLPLKISDFHSVFE